MKLIHQIDDSKAFRHRITYEGAALNAGGKWVNYTTPACFFTTKGTFIGVTDFYKGSPEFPDPNKIYWVREAPENV